MTQRFSFYGDLTVAENLEFVARLYQIRDRRRVIAEVLERIGLADRADQLAQELSGGWKQRMALAACVLHRPRLLLLDEPTAGVDAKARREFWDMIHEMAADGMTVLVSTHYMDEAERCQRVVYLAGGRLVVQGTADEVVRAAKLVTFEATGDGIEQAARRLRRHAWAWRPPRCSAARCASPAWIARHCAPPSTASAMKLCTGRRSSRGSTTCSSTCCGTPRHERFFLRAPVRHAAQGVAADAARPRHCRADGDAAADPALPVRLRDQRQPAASADRPDRRRAFDL